MYLPRQFPRNHNKVSESTLTLSLTKSMYNSAMAAAKITCSLKQTTNNSIMLICMCGNINNTYRRPWRCWRLSWGTSRCCPCPPRSPGRRRPRRPGSSRRIGRLRPEDRHGYVIIIYLLYVFCFCSDFFPVLLLHPSCFQNLSESGNSRYFFVSRGFGIFQNSVDCHFPVLW